MSAVSEVSADFPFDEWMELWRTDPEAAEARRRTETEALINSFSEDSHARRRQLQWRIDQERTRHETPLGATAALTKMAIDRYSSSGGLYDQIASAGPLQEAKSSMLEMHEVLIKLTIKLTEAVKESAQPPAEVQKP